MSNDNFQNPPQLESDEITLKELILLVQEYINLCLKKWWLIGIICILFSALFVVRTYLKPTTYDASVSYTTSDGGLGGLAGGLLGRIAGKGGGASLFKMQGMLQSRLIIEKVLLSKAIVDGENDYILNHLGYAYDFFKERDDPEKMLKPITSPSLESKKDRRFLQAVYKFISKKVLSQGLDDETGIATFSIKTEKEELSYAIANKLYDELEVFYIASEVGEQQKTLSKLETRADSIYNVIQSKTYEVARLQDTDKGRYFATDRLPEVRAQAELKFLQTVYEEVLKNLETIKFTVASSTPTVKAIDMPMLPLKPMPKSYISQLIVGGFLGGFLSVIFIIGRKIFRDIMEDD